MSASAAPETIRIQDFLQPKHSEAATAAFSMIEHVPFDITGRLGDPLDREVVAQQEGASQQPVTVRSTDLLRHLRPVGSTADSAFVHGLLDLRRVDQPPLVGLDLPHIPAAEDDAGGIRSMSGVGDEHRGPGTAPVSMPGADHEHPSHFTVSPGGRLQGDGGQAADLCQVVLQLPHDLKGTL